MRAELMRAEIQRLLRQTPFRPFLLTMQGGEHALIEHPENIAFDPRPGASTEFYVISGSVRLFSTFDAISSASLLTNGTGHGTEQQVST